MKRTIGLLILVLLTISGFAGVQEIKKEKSAEEKEEKPTAKKKKNRIIAAPFVFYSPETRMAYGGGGSYVFRMGAPSKDTRPSTISPVFVYTQEKQIKVQLVTELYFKHNNYRMQSLILGQKYPNKFYGVGDHTLEENEEIYTSKSLDIFFSFSKKVAKGLYVGLQYEFKDWNLVSVEEDGQLISGTVPGGMNGRVSGVGLVLNRDTRDNIYYPRGGDFFEFNARFYTKFLGSKFDFTSLTLDLRKYVTVFSSHVFAVQSLVKVQTGTVPFLHLARMGGEFNMRGYFEGRFRDKNMVVFQAEYRLPLFWRFGLVGFAGLGNVAERFGELKLGSMKKSYGVGLRFLFDKKEKIQIRMDIGFGEDGAGGFYFSVFEAF